MPQNTEEQLKEKVDGKIDDIPEKKSEVLQVPDKVAKFTESLNLISERVTSLVESTKNFEVHEKLEIPKTSMGIKTILDDFEQKDNGLKAMAKQYRTILKDTARQMVEFKLTAPDDLTKLLSLAAVATEAAASVRKCETERKAGVNLFNTAKNEFAKALVTEAGFDSIELALSRRREIRDMIYRYENSFILGLGKVLHGKKLRPLREESDKLEKIQSALNQRDKSYFYDRDLESDEGTVITSLVHNVNVFSDLAVAELSKPEQEQGPELELSPGLVGELNDTYIDKIVRKDMAEAMRESRKYGSVEKDFGTKEDREQATALLKEAFGVAMNKRIWNEPEEEERKKERIQKSLQELPHSLQSTVRRRIGSNRDNDTWIGFNKGVIGVKTEQYVKKLKEVLEAVRKICSGTENYYVNRAGDGAREYEFSVFRTAPQFNEEDAINFDVSRWNVFKLNESVRRGYGDASLDQYQKIVEDKIAKTLLEARQHKNDFTLATELIALKSIKSTPYVLLDAFRVSGDGGGHHLIGTGFGDRSPDQTKLYEYISSFNENDIERLKEMNIPGLVEVVEMIRNNRNNFCLERVRASNNEDENEWVDNPVYKKIQEELERVSCYFLEHGNQSEKMFTLRTIQDPRSPMGTQAGLVSKILDEKRTTLEEGNLQDRAVDLLLTRFKWHHDFEAAKILIGSQKILGNRNDVLFEMAFKWKEITEKHDSETFKKDVELIGNNLKSKLQEMIKEKDPKNKFIGYIVARNLGLEFKPTSSDVIEFFRSAKQLSSIGNSNETLTHIIGLADIVTFSPDEGYEIARMMSENPYLGVFSSNNRVIREFVDKLPTGDKFSEGDKKALLSHPNLLGTAELHALSSSVAKVTDENWTTMLGTYTLSEAELLRLEPETRKAVRLLFSNEHPENRDLCLRKLRDVWNKYLDDKNHTFPIDGAIICEAVKKSDEEAGDLKYVSALANVMNSVEGLSERKKTAPRTRTEIFGGLQRQEKRMVDGRWGEDDKAAFYNISNAILKAAPSLYTDFLELFEAMSGKEIKTFAKELYPLYQANLVVLEKGDDSSFSGRDLVPIRKRLEVMKSNFEQEGSDTGTILEKERTELITSIQQTFEKRFGLLKIPENLTEEHIRTLQNCVRYIGNIHGRDQNKETLVSLYLGLTLNGKWEDFRSGTEINLAEYFSGESLKISKPILEKRRELNKIPSEIIGLSFERTLEFQKSMQEETISNMVGNVQTIDVKLGNAKRNLEDLTDPDIYPDPADREVLALVGNEGKIVGTTLSKIYAETAGKKVGFSDSELVVRKNLERIYQIDRWTPAKVKEVQDKVQVPNLICSVLRKLDEEEVDVSIGKLQVALTPSKEIIEIFNSFGEEFTVNSGALALSQDVSYLENIIVKNEKKLSAEHKVMLDNYLGAVRSQMSALESVYVRVKEYFEKIKKGAHVIKNETLKNRLSEIEKVLYQSDGAVSVTTRVTTNLNLIIENMRKCLGCLRKEENNDTNLTFGDCNKFYVMSQGEREKGNIADEIIYFSPIKMPDGSEGMSFVLDKIYGSQSSDVLLAHIKAVLKKYSSLKKTFPDAKTSVLVTNSALSSGGLSKKQAEAKIKEIYEAATATDIEGATVTISESALGDHYVEFGNHIGRFKGETNVSGLRIEL